MVKVGFRPQWLVFPKLSIEANPEHDPSEPIVDMEIEIGSDLSQDENNSLQATLFISNENFAENNALYSVDMHLFAAFKCNMPFDKIPKKVSHEMMVDMANLLLGSAREMISTITSRGPWGTYILPIVSAEELASDLTKSLIGAQASE